MILATTVLAALTITSSSKQITDSDERQFWNGPSAFVACEITREDCAGFYRAEYDEKQCPECRSSLDCMKSTPIIGGVMIGFAIGLFSGIFMTAN